MYIYKLGCTDYKWYVLVYTGMYWYIHSTTAYIPVHTLCVNSYTNIPVHTCTYLYIPVYRSICQYKRIWKICITIGIELTTSCIVSVWLYRFAKSTKASVFCCALLLYLLSLCSVRGTHHLAAGVGCPARVPPLHPRPPWHRRAGPPLGSPESSCQRHGRI